MRKLLLLLATVMAFSILPVQTAHAVPEKRFSIRCQFSHGPVAHDPIVSPGTESAHLHQFFGNESTDADSRYRRMLKAPTTCDLGADTAAYWTPALVAPDGEVVLGTQILAYYRNVAATYESEVTPFPRNFRVVSADYRYSCGDRRSTDSPGPIDCTGQSGEQKYVRLSILFPQCGQLNARGRVRKDSPDHASHVANTTARGCPASHPVVLPRLSIIVKFPVMRLTSNWQLTSGPLHHAHGDFWNTWQQPELKALVERCLSPRTNEFPCGLQED